MSIVLALAMGLFATFLWSRFLPEDEGMFMTSIVSIGKGDSHKFMLDGMIIKNSTHAVYAVSYFMLAVITSWIALHAIITILRRYNGRESIRRHMLASMFSRIGLIIVNCITAFIIFTTTFYLTDKGGIHTVGVFKIIIFGLFFFMMTIVAPLTTIENNNNIDDWNGVFNIKKIIEDYLYSREKYDNIKEEYKHNLNTLLQHE